MKNTTAVIAAAILSALSSTFADQAATPGSAKPTPEQTAERDQRVLKKTGGLLHTPASGPAVVILDARAKTDKAPEKVADVFTKAAKQPISAVRAGLDGKSPLDAGIAKLSADKALMVIVVADAGDGVPSLGVYPEERVAVVNATRLSSGGDVFTAETRVIKEIWRSIGFIGGAGYSQAENDVMQPVFSTAELDANAFQVMQPMSYPKMRKMFDRFGVKRSRIVPYRLAVREGWANAPTNEYQKAVWEEEKARSATNKTDKAPAVAK